jgi:hypothetical protein
MGFPVEMFPVLFAIPRTSGWIAQWEEMLLDPEQKISRPKAGCTSGRRAREYVPLTNRELRVLRRAAVLVCVRLGAPSCRSAPAPSRRLKPPHRRRQRAARPEVRRGLAPWTDLQRQVDFGPRPAGTPALAKTRQ